jgi:hypothetical protein
MKKKLGIEKVFWFKINLLLLFFESNLLWLSILNVLINKMNK